MQNMENKIKAHNKKILHPPKQEIKTECNCRDKESCPLDGNCREKAIIYECTVLTTGQNNKEQKYIGATEGEVKQRVGAHRTSFNDGKYRTSSELSKYIWGLKQTNQQYQLKWKIIDKSYPYINGSKRCNLCTTEKLHIINANDKSTINKRSELISKCRHENKFYLRNYNKPRKKTQH
tara:strand:+ start:125 stop:658 length:534 start_codon:yes stop_codon:yes gene_type:complete